MNNRRFTEQKPRSFDLRNESGFGLVEAMITVGIMAIVAVQYATMMTNQINNEARNQFWTNANTLNDEIRSTLSNPSTCYNSLGNGFTPTASSDVLPAQIGDAANMYKVGSNYGFGAVSIKKMELNSYVKNPTNPTQAQMTLHIHYAPTKAKGAEHELQIPITFDTGPSGQTLSCIPQAKMTDGIWQRPASNQNNIFFIGPVAANGSAVGNPGNVGIGTNSPSGLLDVHADSTTAAAVPNGITISGKATGAGNGHALSFMQNSTTTPSASISSIVDPTGAGSEMHFSTTNKFGAAAISNVMIDLNGQMGIGTNAPTAPLHVENGAYFNAPIGGAKPLFALEAYGNSFIGSKQGSYVQLTPQAKYPYSLLTAFTKIDQVGLMHTDGKVMVATWIGGKPQVGQIGTLTNHAFQLYTNNTPVLTLWKDQTSYFADKVGIHAPFIGNAMLSVGGDIAAQGSIHADGDMTATGTVYANAASYSDRRLKRDITPLIDPLEQILKLDGVNYYWKDKKRGTSLQMGLIAQDVAKVYPDSVVNTPDGYKAILYTSLISPIIESIKSIYSKLLGLDSRVEKLEAQLAETKQQLADERAAQALNQKNFLQRLEALEKAQASH